MLKTKLISSLLLLLLLVSCNSNSNSNPDIEGVWVNSYNHYTNHENITTKEYPDFPYFIQIKNNTIHIKWLENKGLSIPVMDTLFNFTLHNNQMIIDNDLNSVLDIISYQDSLVVTFDDNKNARAIYRKLPETTKKVDWNPTGNLYKVIKDGKQMNLDFINDSISLGYDLDNIDVNEYSWQITHVDEYRFLVLTTPSFDFKTNLIDSISDNKVYLTDYIFDKKGMTYEKQENINIKPTTLFGTWILTAKENLVENDSEVHDPYRINDLQKLKIEEDVITISHKPFTTMFNWTYLDNEHIILFQKERKMMKVVKVTTDTLVLEMNLSELELNNKRFVFKRE